MKSHDAAGDQYSRKLGLTVCPHFTNWIASLPPMSPVEETDLLSSFATLEPHVTVNVGKVAIGHLLRTDVPRDWSAVISTAMAMGARHEFMDVAVAALYAEVERCIYLAPPKTSGRVLALAHMVEAAIALEYWFMGDIESSNYIPMGHVESWWPDYINLIDSYLTSDQLRDLSGVNGTYASETECLSSITTTDRLMELYGSNPIVCAANSNLPAHFVREKMEHDDYLIFHPNADPDLAWGAVELMLNDGSFEDLGSIMGEFDNMRDESWFQLSGFAYNSPQADAIRAKIQQWCEDNIEDRDDLEEALEYLGFI